MNSRPHLHRCWILLTIISYRQLLLQCLAFSPTSLQIIHRYQHQCNRSTSRTVHHHLHSATQSHHEEGNSSRRHALFHLSLLTSIPILHSLPSQALAITPLEGKGGTQTRIQGIGGGFDILSPNNSNLSSSDVYYPASMVNTSWRAQRVIASVEGDAGQAATMWTLLGGGASSKEFNSQLTEVYEVSFVAAPDSFRDAMYDYEGKTVRAAVMDRASSLSSRLGFTPSSSPSNTIQWDKESPQQTVAYSRNNKDTIVLTTVQRKNEPPTEVGFGSDELLKISSSSGIMGSTTTIDRAARIKTRYRRGYDEITGKRIIDGIELVMTYRVLDGVAGVEMPTSSCKSRIRWTEL